jgi:hypothetical protein
VEQITTIEGTKHRPRNNQDYPENKKLVQGANKDYKEGTTFYHPWNKS